MRSCSFKVGARRGHTASFLRLPEHEEMQPGQDPVVLACPDSDGTSHNIVPSKAVGTQPKGAQDIDSDSFFSLLMLKVPHLPPLLVLEGESNSQDQSHLWWPGWWNAVEPSELHGEGTDSRAFGG